jgi:hypothetical protein
MAGAVSGLVLVLGLTEALVLGFDGCGFFGRDGLEKLEKLGGLEGVEVKVGAGAVGRAGGVDDDEWELGVDGVELFDEAFTRGVLDAGVDDDTVDQGEALEGLNGFFAAVGGDDVEFGGLNDELSRGDAAGVFAVDNEETGPGHVSIIGGFAEVLLCAIYDIMGPAVGWKC